MTWLIPFGVFQLLLVPRGYGMFGTSWVGGLFYLCAAGTCLALFRREVREAKPGTGRLLGPGLALVLTGIVTAVAYATVPDRLTISAERLAQFRALQIGLIRMDGVYLAVKLPELILQQTMIWILVRRLQASGRVGAGLIGAFALIFAGVHLPILALKGLAGLPFILAAAGASLLFVPLIARFRGGVGYSYSVHLIAYVIAGAVLRATP